MSEKTNVPAKAQNTTAVAEVDQKQKNLQSLMALGYTEEDIKVIRNVIAPTATYPELYMYLSVASAMKLNPIAKQIHFVKRNTKRGPVVSIQVGIDGFRSIADRTGLYAGNDEPVFEYEEGNPYPIKATVTVWKIVAGQRVSFTRSAYWNEYYPGDGKDGFMWRKMPHTMLAKCAEALALRVAFPAQLSGVYTVEEMHQSDLRVQTSYPDTTMQMRVDVNPKDAAFMPSPSDVTSAVVEDAVVVDSPSRSEGDTHTEPEPGDAASTSGAGDGDADGGEPAPVREAPKPAKAKAKVKAKTKAKSAPKKKSGANDDLAKLIASLGSSSDPEVWYGVYKDAIEHLSEEDKAVLRDRYLTRKKQIDEERQEILGI